MAMTQFLLVDGTTWGDVWAMTGMGFGVVLVVLVVLVFILMAFGALSKIKAPKKSAAAPAAQPMAEAKPLDSASDADKAAVAMALYLYYKDVHDEETGVITIQHNRHSAWHHELNKHLNQD